MKETLVPRSTELSLHFLRSLAFTGLAKRRNTESRGELAPPEQLDQNLHFQANQTS